MGDYKFTPISIHTVFGEKLIQAPQGFVYDRTAKLAWHKLINLTEEYEHKKNSKRTLKSEKVAMVAQRRVLANLLANSLGMADFFWEQASSELAKTM